MPLNFSSLASKINTAVFESNILNKCLANNFLFAFCISLFFITLVMIIYPAKKGTSISVVIKLFIYIYLTLLCLLLLHDGVAKKNWNADHKERQNNDLFDALGPESNNPYNVSLGGSPTINLNGITDKPIITAPTTPSADKSDIYLSVGSSENIPTSKPPRNRRNPFI
jgi:hypothetical protein